MVVRKFVSFVFLILAVGMLSASTSLLIVRHKLLNADYYINALNDANFYSEAEIVIKDNIDSFLEARLKITENNSFGPKLASKIIRSVIENIDLAALLQRAMEENIRNITSWLNGDKNFEVFFPRTDLTKAYEGNSGGNLFSEQFIEISGFNNLPECSSNYVYDELDLANGKVECKNSSLSQKILEEILSKIPGNMRTNLMTGFLDSVFPGFDENTPIDRLQMRSEQMERIRTIPDKVQTTLYIVIISIVGSLVIGGLSTLLSPKPALNFLKMFLYSGIVMVVISLLAKFGVMVMANFFVWNKLDLPPNIFTEEQRTQIKELLRAATESLLNNLLMTVIITGGIFVILSLVLIVIFKFARIIKSDDYDEDLQEDEEEVEIKQPESKKSFEKDLLEKKPEMPKKLLVEQSRPNYESED